MKKQKILAVLLTGALTAGLAACGSADIGTDASSSVSGSSSTASAVSGSSTVTVKTGASGPAADTDATTEEEKQSIESKLNLANNSDVTWSYDSQSDSWTMSITCAVANPELEDYQGVSVNVPGAYVKGIDTDGDGTEDVTADSYSDAVNGTLVIDNDAKITSENGQVYTASTAPVVINTGAAGYSAQENQLASSTYAADGYINVACGNRGKQSTAENSDGESYYTGDAPLCLVDQKNAIRFVKYNILLGNLPGNTEYFVSTGGSGGGAHATMVAATSNNSDFYDYEIEAGAVGVYRNEDGSYSTAVSVNGTDAEISDGVWGCIAYSAISSLAEADMAMAFEYNLDTEYSFNTDFQKQLATYLSQEYMDYINDQNLSVSEAAVGFDLNEDGDTDDTVSLTIEYDENKYADTNGYGGTYLTLYLDEFEQNLNWYLENLDYADGWTWFDTDGNALTDDEVASMTTEDKAEAFLEGRYAKSESADNAGGPGGSAGGSAPAAGQAPSGGNPPSGGDSTSAGNAPSGGNGTSAGNPPDSQGSSGEDIASSSNAMTGGMPESQVTSSSNTQSAQLPSGDTEKAGTPDQGTTQSADSSVDSSNYSTFDEIVEAYKEDIASIEAGDKYGNNIVDLYNPLNYIGDDDTDGPTWTRIMMGASEGDMSMFSSLNLQIAWLNAGTDAEIEWQWDGGHGMIDAFHETCDIPVQLFEYGSNRAQSLVSTGKLDVALVNMEFYNIDQFESHELMEDDYSLCVSRTHPLAGETSVSLEKLAQENLIFYNTDSVQNLTFMTRFRALGIQPHILMHCSQLYTTLNFVRAGTCSAILFSSLAVNPRDFRMIPIEPRIVNKFGIIWKAGDYIPLRTTKFIQFAKKYDITPFVK